MQSLNHANLLSLLPKRDPLGHKGTFGKVLLLCGSKGYTGAPWLASMGALRSGTGMVFLGVPESIYAIEAVKLNEPVVIPLEDKEGKLSEEAIPVILEKLKGMDAVLIGCGMGQSLSTLAVTKAVLQEARCPVVLDADGINVLKDHKDILKQRVYPTVMTPHEGEFLRFGGSLESGREQAAQEYAAQWGCVLVLKGHHTVISDGDQTCINPTGNPGMAVAGCGDVLAGIIVSLLGQGIAPMEAAAFGAWLHGAAGDLCEKELGQYGMLPTDMLRNLPKLLN